MSQNAPIDLQIMRTIKTILFVVVLGITGSCKNTLVEPDVVEIAVKDRETGQIQSITDKDSLERIVANVNSNKKEFCIFNAQKEMTLKYKSKKDVSILINSNGHYFKIDGKTYATSRGL